MKTLQLPDGAETKIPSPDFKIDWTGPKPVNTRQGERHLFTAALHPDFWPFWKSHKDALKAAGFAPSKDGQKWQLNLWRPTSKDDSGKPKPAPSKFSEILLKLSRADKVHNISADLGGFPTGVKPFDYQSAGIQYALMRERVIIGDDMGLGKTLQAIGVCNHLKSERVLIVCPAGLRLNWRDELGKFSNYDPSDVAVIESGKNADLIAKHKVIIVSYDLAANPRINAEVRSRHWDAVICDEAHYLKNKATKRSIALLGVPPLAKGKGPKLPIDSRRWMFLTGTPISNRPSDFWNLLRFCVPEFFGKWMKYADEFCDAKPIGYGKRGWDTSGASNLDKLQELVRGTCMVRRLKKDVLKQLPSKTRKLVALPAPHETVRELDALTMEFKTAESTIERLKEKVGDAKEIGDADALKIATEQLQSAQSALFTETSKVRKEIGLKKVDLAVEHVRNILAESGGKVIVGAHHVGVVEGLRAGLKDYAPQVVTGSTSSDSRHKAVNAFQNDPNARVFIGNILAAGTGLTLTAAPHVVIVEPDWVPANNAQFEDRAHRIGQSQPVLVEYLALEGTLDVQVLKTVAKKMEIINEATDAIATERKVDRSINEAKPKPHKPTPSVVQREQEDSQWREKKIKIAKFGQSLDPRTLILSVNALRQVAALDGDRASSRNDVGFSSMDTDTGNRLAEKRISDLSDWEKGKVAALAYKYRRQIPQSIVDGLINPKGKI